ncbi:unnamed protein product [Gongylonema pulchrum]|uniref:Uncharacterized protein n=1 Tax=Gongylonema pulchrum TaxID=637853 RepID=A0A3P7NBF7_9BILA|nr:unnamed protein product [Gongylonema pulchrum]
MAKLKEDAKKEESGEASSSSSSSSKVQMRSVWRYLVRFAAPSTACLVLSRTYCTGGGSGRPQMFQLEHIRKRLEITAPQFFRQQPDYTFYRPNVEYRDEIFQANFVGREKLMAYFGAISVICQFCYPHVEMEASLLKHCLWLICLVLSILPVSEDGTVRLRWRVKYVSLIRAILDPKLFKYDNRIKKTMEDEDRQAAPNNRLANLAEKVGVLPKGATVMFDWPTSRIV